jgi:hypothetical protein
MTAPSNYICNYTKAGISLAAGVATDVDVPIDGAADWQVIVKNTGSTNAVTALSVTRIPLTLPGPAESVSTGIPLAHGDSLRIAGSREPLSVLRLTLTSTSGTTVSVEAGGR